MIYVTGDTHGQHDFAKLEILAKSGKTTENDFVIIAGDFGGVWSEATLDEKLKPYEDLPFTVLFVDGNHENFEILNALPVEEWRGGKIHRVRKNVIHLIRGEIFDLEGKTFFVFGGATSEDRTSRYEHISWWAEEMPSYVEFDYALKNLEKAGNKVDYIITHSCDERALYYPPLVGRNIQKGVFPENKLLTAFEETIDYKHWYFGHYHMDGDLTDKKTVLYNEIIRLGDGIKNGRL